MGRKKKDYSFEEAIDELEMTVNQLENGDLSLDESLTKFQKGIELYKYCNELLNKAEGQVKIILSNNYNELEEVDFDTNE
ncbi:exodeoxyribonuclease VII small subunit [Brassicibacter mesophilus]|uniref:exodeoxyribonuclease VII small subunit n=1 Tax=Brassicibacter mesophilus TaxID=745119 RepID=UPI003D21BF12